MSIIQKLFLIMCIYTYTDALDYDTNSHNIPNNYPMHNRYYDEPIIYRVKKAANNNRPNRRQYEYTDEGIVIKGGYDLPPEFRGSGSADFAFDGDSFRSYGTYERPKNNQPPKMLNDWFYPNDIPSIESTNSWGNENNVFNVNPTPSQINNEDDNSNSIPKEVYVKPNICQRRCHQRITPEYNPVCGSDGATYTNMGKFTCAVNCGKAITYTGWTACPYGAPVV